MLALHRFAQGSGRDPGQLCSRLLRARLCLLKDPILPVNSRLSLKVLQRTEPRQAGSGPDRCLHSWSFTDPNRALAFQAKV